MSLATIPSNEISLLKQVPDFNILKQIEGMRLIIKRLYFTSKSYRWSKDQHHKIIPKLNELDLHRLLGENGKPLETMMETLDYLAMITARVQYIAVLGIKDDQDYKFVDTYLQIITTFTLEYSLTQDIELGLFILFMNKYFRYCEDNWQNIYKRNLKNRLVVLQTHYRNI